MAINTSFPIPHYKVEMGEKVEKGNTMLKI
jgi:hypothetical protein